MAWQNFLGPGESPLPQQTMEFRVLRRGHRDWLILPRDRQQAVRTLDLYAAQRTPARVARSLLGLALRFPFPIRTQQTDVALDAAFPSFLAHLAGTSPAMPEVGILAGNPKVEGARHVFLVFDRSGRPCAVAKAGHGEKAQALIRHESDFLEENSGKLPGLPRFLGRMECDETTALATAFVEGKSPPPDPPPAMGEFLSNWIHEREVIPFPFLETWTRLRAVSVGDPLFERLAATIGERRVHPVVWHGDFTPWNIKVTPAGEWIIVDCERSERQGVPGWNWLHYVVQSGVLIEQLALPSLLKRVEAQLHSDSFRDYARATGINGIEREVLLSYLLYLLRILKPVKGVAEIEGLLEAMAPQ